MSFFYLNESSTKTTIPVTLGMNLLRHYPEESIISFPHHNHEIFEILYIVSGSIKIVIDNTTYNLKKGDLAIINPFQLHYGEYPNTNNNNEHLALTLNLRKWFSTNYAIATYEPILKSLEGFVNYIPSDNQYALQIADILLHMEDLFNNISALNYFLLSTEINNLFYTLYNNFHIKIDNTTEINHNYDFTSSVAQYLKKTYTEDISGVALANAIHMAKTQFYQKFKDNFGMSFTNYLGFYRVTKAVEIYKETPMTFDKLASLVGFSDYDYFAKTFKKHMGESPARYFNKWNPQK